MVQSERSPVVSKPSLKSGVGRVSAVLVSAGASWARAENAGSRAHRQVIRAITSDRLLRIEPLIARLDVRARTRTARANRQGELAIDRAVGVRRTRTSASALSDR